MSAIKQDILWSPHHKDRFLTIGTDLKLYSYFDSKVDEVTDAAGASTSSSAKPPKLLALHSDNQYLKCVCWHPTKAFEDLVAVGLANGRVVLTSFNLPNSACQLAGKEFIPRHARHCNTVAWNSEDTNLLAAGLDRNKTDFSLLIWDVVKSGPFMGDPERRSLPGTSDGGGLSTKPSVEMAYAEIVHSMNWLNNSSKTLIAGITHKYLKFYDIRESANGLSTSATTKAVYGVCTDPFFSYRIASYFENQVLLWDSRNFEKPVVVLYDVKPIIKIAWCPTRANLLGSLCKDAYTLKLYDVQKTNAGNDELEPTVVERSLQPVGNQLLQSFCWHSTQENRILATSNFTDFQNHIVCERTTLNWSPTSTLVWSEGNKLQFIDQTDAVYDTFDDISVKMKRRAQAGYGLEMQHLWKNGELVKDDEQLRNLWFWLHLKGMRDETRFRATARGLSCSVGVHTIIRGETLGNGGTRLKSDFSLRSWVEAPTFAHIPAFKSVDREKALHMCGWTYDSDGSISDQFLDRLQFDGHHERAAAIAVFNLKILKAMEILNKGALKNVNEVDGVPLSIVAMALSGYVGDRNSLWRETCDRMRSKLRSPYLIATFAFLTCENDSYDEVLSDRSGLTVRDRVAFACIFLPDNKLVDLLDRLAQQLIDAGNLDGLLLTGLGRQGVDLLQHYVDLTGDIQTASHIALQALLSSFEMDSRVDQWIKCYRELLDQWRLWQERAKFDVNWRNVDPNYRAPQQVFISCNFCGKTISTFKDPTMRARQYVKISGAPNKSKFSSCPGCRKPLPRCALCLVHMGTPSGSISTTSDDRSDKIKELQKLSTFDTWFTWCQTCRHGGHANHIAVWFKDHMECPVTGCRCTCMAVDSFSDKDLENFIPTKPSS